MLASIPGLDEIGLDPRIIAFAVTVSVAASVASGLWPLLDLRRANLVSSLADNSTAGGSSHRTIRRRAAIMVGQVAVASLLHRHRRERGGDGHDDAVALRLWDRRCGRAEPGGGARGDRDGRRARLPAAGPARGRGRSGARAEVGMTRAIVVALLIASAAACASRRPAAVVMPPPDVTRAGALVRAGCYRCLADALAVYDEALRATRQPDQTLLRAAFDTALLKAMREKELGLPSLATLDRARALAAVLPAINGPAWIDLVELVADEPSVVPPEAKRPPPAERAERAKTARAALAAEPRSLVADYLDLALACEDRTAREAIDRDAVLNATGNAPAIRYRLAICSVMIGADIVKVREDDPRWTEILWFEGRRFIALQDIWKARAKLEEAAAAMPESPAVLLTYAGVQQALSQLEPSVVTFDQVIVRCRRCARRCWAGWSA
jgi:hypothetical protein